MRVNYCAALGHKAIHGIACRFNVHITDTDVGAILSNDTIIIGCL
ncbi:hypothetical protein [Pseudomonas sp. ML2-2023-3]